MCWAGKLSYEASSVSVCEGATAASAESSPVLFGYEVCTIQGQAQEIDSHENEACHSADTLPSAGMVALNMQPRDSADWARNTHTWAENGIMGWRYNLSPQADDCAPHESSPKSGPASAVRPSAVRPGGMLSLNCVHQIDQEDANPFSASPDITPAASTRSSYNSNWNKTPHSPAADSPPVHQVRVFPRIASPSISTLSWTFSGFFDSRGVFAWNAFETFA